MTDTVDRPTKSAAKPAEKPSIIFVATLTCKPIKVTPKTALVLDTNVVLDWLVFRNPACVGLGVAIETGQVRWLVTEALRDELAHVVGRGVVDAWSPDLEKLWACWHTLSESVTPTEEVGIQNRLRCTDPDDQKFVDLAVLRADWLISRDRAVLKLAKRATRYGLRISTPERWQAD